MADNWAPPEEDFNNTSSTATQSSNAWTPPETDFPQQVDQTQPEGKSLSGFLSNAGSDISDTIGGVGNLAKGLVTHPIDTVTGVAKNIIPATYNEYKDLITHPIEHSYAHPINTALDALPFIEGASEAGPVERAATASAADLTGSGYLDSLKSAVSGNPEVEAVIKNAKGGAPSTEDLLTSTGELKRAGLSKLADLNTAEPLPLDLSGYKTSFDNVINKLSKLSDNFTAGEEGNPSPEAFSKTGKNLFDKAAPYKLVRAELDKMGENPTIGDMAQLKNNLSTAGWDTAAEGTGERTIYEDLRNKISEIIKNPGAGQEWNNTAKSYNKLSDIQRNLGERQAANKFPTSISGIGKSLQNASVGEDIGAALGLYGGPGILGKAAGAFVGRNVGGKIQAALTKYLLEHPKLAANIAPIVNNTLQKKDAGYAEGGMIPDDVKSYVSKIQDEPGIQDATVGDFGPLVMAGIGGGAEAADALGNLGEKGIIRLGDKIVSTPEEIESTLNKLAEGMSNGEKIQAGPGSLEYVGKQPGYAELPDTHLFNTEGMNHPMLPEGTTVSPATLGKYLGDAPTEGLENLEEVKPDYQSDSTRDILEKFGLQAPKTPTNLNLKDFMK